MVILSLRGTMGALSEGRSCFSFSMPKSMTEGFSTLLRLQGVADTALGSSTFQRSSKGLPVSL